jgi:hypothetical protein
MCSWSGWVANLELAASGRIRPAAVADVAPLSLIDFAHSPTNLFGYIGLRFTNGGVAEVSSDSVIVENPHAQR